MLILAGTLRPQSTRRKPMWKRQLMILSRWLHIYLSMASFGIVFFFAVTGLTLNHAEWFAGQQHTVQVQGSMDREMIAPKVLKDGGRRVPASHSQHPGRGE